MGSKHEMWELYQLQSLPLRAKIQKTKDNIQQWINAFGRDGVYVSFSGGKDSTVLLDIAREVYPQMPAVFIDTGLEYPEVRNFAKSFENIEVLKPKMSFEQVIKKYGYPFISKEVSECVQGAKRYLKRLNDEGIIEYADQLSMLQMTPGGDNKYRKLMGIGEYSKSSQLAEVLNQRMLEKSGGSNQRLAIMLGMLTRSKTHPVQVLTSQNDRSAYSQTKYKFLLDAPFKISPKCCDIMKKAPAHEYAKISGRLPITAQMAFESRLRTQKWLQNGCNGFNLKIPTSNPMAFWTEQDVLLYIKENSLKIASVYGDIVEDYSGSNQVNNQMSLLDFGIFDLERPSLKTTGCNRTGCVFCGFGCHLEKPQQGRFERLSTTHPKFFDYVMRGGSFNEDGMWQPSNGLGYWFIILWIREHGNINIAAPRLDEYRKKYSDSKAERLLRKGDNYGQTNRG